MTQAEEKDEKTYEDAGTLNVRLKRRWLYAYLLANLSACIVKLAPCWHDRKQATGECALFFFLILMQWRYNTCVLSVSVCTCKLHLSYRNPMSIHCTPPFSHVLSTTRYRLLDNGNFLLVHATSRDQSNLFIPFIANLPSFLLSPNDRSETTVLLKALCTSLALRRTLYSTW